MSEVAVPETAPIMSLIERLAFDPAVGVDKVERLVALYERTQAFSAKRDYAEAFVRMKPHLPKIARTKHNPQTGSFYAPLEDISEVVDPILHEYGFAFSSKIVAQDDKSVTVRGELWHTLGHVESTDVTVPLDDKGMAGRISKTPPHATASSITYGRRYAKCAILDIATGADHDGNLPPRGKLDDVTERAREQLRTTSSAYSPAPIAVEAVERRQITPRRRSLTGGLDRAILEQYAWNAANRSLAELEEFWTGLKPSQRTALGKDLLDQLKDHASQLSDDRTNNDPDPPDEDEEEDTDPVGDYPLETDEVRK